MSAHTVPVAVFRLGRIIATPNALQSITQDDILTGIQRHLVRVGLGALGASWTVDYVENRSAELISGRFELLAITAGKPFGWGETSPNFGFRRVKVGLEYRIVPEMIYIPRLAA
jgi:hypothetical protein